VVVIETKKPEPGKFRVTYSGNLYISPDFVNVSPKNHLQIMGRYVDVVS